jgi:5-(carboxyamino)imidazole ribonucleotide synthase
MTSYAAYRLGLDVGVMARPADDNPAAGVATHTWMGAWDDRALLEDLAKRATAVTLENEFVDPAVLAFLESRGVAVHPSSKTLSMVQDKHTQKVAFARVGLPVPRFAAVGSVQDVLDQGQVLGWPMVLKARRNGYDGYGNALLREPADVEPAFQKLRARSELMVEEFVAFTSELAIMVARGRKGDEVVYPLTETIQHAHMCHTVLVPAPVSAATVARAQDVARKVVKTLDGVGVFGVELFLLNDGEVLVNEVAPRPHNSGHYTLEACVTSQFENLVRAVMGWPLGAATMLAPAAAMVNVLGSHAGPTHVGGLADALAVPGVTVHLYGKANSRPGRKMGHVTAVGESITATRERALKAARAITI